MGLDMMLYARREAYNGYEEDTIKLYPQELQKILIGKTQYAGGLSRERVDDYKIGYWRKANAIHKYFVDNCADGEDDCRVMKVGESVIDDLLDRCLEVLNDNSKAEELLPTTDGCFFGSTEYDEYYFEDIKKTIEILNVAKAVLALNKRTDKKDGTSWSIAYCASW